MIERYEHSKHSPMLKTWLAARHLELPDSCMFSDIGYCVDGTAIGFLYTTNSKQAHIDQIAANPAVSSEARSQALDQLIEALEKAAKDLGYAVVRTVTAVSPMQKRFVSHSYQVSAEPYQLFFKVLS